MPELVIFVIVAGFLLLYFGRYFRTWKRDSKGTKNRIYSSGGVHCTFVYRIPHTRKEVLEMLGHKNGKDILSYRVVSEEEIRFANSENCFYEVEWSGAGYRMNFQDTEDGCILYLEQMELLTPNSASMVHLQMNTFWKEKADAVPCDVKKESL